MFKIISKAYKSGLLLGRLCFYGRVSVSGFYRWRRNYNAKILRDFDDVKLVRDISDKHNNKIGIRRISMSLRDSGIIMNVKKIARIKREYKIITKIRKSKPYNILIKKDLQHRVVPNILHQNFDVKLPDSVLCTDITYLFYRGGVGYLSATKDVATREIVAHHISGNMSISAGCDSLEKLFQSKNMRGTIIHSDQGVHYTHPKYIELLSKNGIVQSMSRKGVCLDNAPIESFFGHMKDEMGYKKCRNLSELSVMVDNYINHYNNDRSQWDLKKMPPVKYREHLLSFAT